MELRKKGQLGRRRKVLTAAQSARLDGQKRRLAEKLTKWNKAMAEKLGSGEEGFEVKRNWAEHDEEGGADEDLEEEEEDDDEEGLEGEEGEEGESQAGSIVDPLEDSEESDEEEENECHPESMDLILPSTLGPDKCLEKGMGRLLEQEVVLREAQAAEAISKLRVALGYKSLLMRDKLQKTKGKKRRTRVWTEIQRVSDEVTSHVASYRRAKTVVDAILKAGDPRRERLRPINREDLKMVGGILEEHRMGAIKPGKKRKRGTDRKGAHALAWFWRLETQGEDGEEDSWLEEGKWKSIQLVISLMSGAVNRVCWLRAKALQTRWTEELELVRHEMGWTVRWFEHQKKVWRERSQGEEREGAQCYGWRQVAMWGAMGEKARRAFSNDMIL